MAKAKARHYVILRYICVSARACKNMQADLFQEYILSQAKPSTQRMLKASSHSLCQSVRNGIKERAIRQTADFLRTSLLWCARRTVREYNDRLQEEQPKDQESLEIHTHRAPPKDTDTTIERDIRVRCSRYLPPRPGDEKRRLAEPRVWLDCIHLEQSKRDGALLLELHSGRYGPDAQPLLPAFRVHLQLSYQPVSAANQELLDRRYAREFTNKPGQHTILLECTVECDDSHVLDKTESNPFYTAFANKTAEHGEAWRRYTHENKTVTRVRWPILENDLENAFAWDDMSDHDFWFNFVFEYLFESYMI